MDVAKLRTYFRKDLGWGRGYQQDAVFGLLCAASQEAENGVLLDVGAGHQRYRPFFERSLYLAQEHPVAGVQNKALKRYDILSDARLVPLVDNCVDVVLSTVSFEHFEYPNQFLSESLRVLKPGGRLFLQAPFIFYEHEIPYDFQRLTRYGMRRDVAAAGFRAIRIDATSSSTRCAVSMLQYALEEDTRRMPPRSLRRLLRRTIHHTLRPVLALLNHVYDRGPDTDTRLPIGWTVTATKPGQPTGRSHWPSAAEFLAANRLRRADIAFEGGVLTKRDLDIVDRCA